LNNWSILEYVAVAVILIGGLTVIPLIETADAKPKEEKGNKVYRGYGFTYCSTENTQCPEVRTEGFGSFAADEAAACQEERERILENDNVFDATNCRPIYERV
jgi:hypothetical protein